MALIAKAPYHGNDHDHAPTQHFSQLAPQSQRHAPAMAPAWLEEPCCEAVGVLGGAPVVGDDGGAPPPDMPESHHAFLFVQVMRCKQKAASTEGL